LLLPAPPLTHIPARRAAAQRLLGWLERRKQPHVMRNVHNLYNYYEKYILIID
jgi:hypothetical protein